MFEHYGRSPLPGELYEKWPKSPEGNPVTPKMLIHCTSLDMADTMLVSMLRAYGIPAMIIHPGDGDFGKLMLGMSGTGSFIFVPETMYDEAKELMEAEPDELQS